MVRLIIISLSLLFMPLASSGDTFDKISAILMYEQAGLVYIYPEGGVQNPPSCQAPNVNYLSFKLARPMGKEYLSVLMMAFSLQKKVYFRTARDCVDQSTSDTILYFRVMN